MQAVEGSNPRAITNKYWVSEVYLLLRLFVCKQFKK